jgi:SagB-type dehydrogenase family enzyme
MDAAVQFKRSPHVVCSWDGPVVSLYNYAVGKSVLGSVHLCTIVTRCREWRSRDEIAAACPGVARSEVGSLIRSLVRAQILYRSDRPEPAAERVMARFARWNPVAGFFHTATKDVPFAERQIADRALAVRELEQGGAPAPVKRYPGRPTVTLPTPDFTGQFCDVLLERRTWRRFLRRPVAVAELSILLALTAGIQKWVLGGPAGRSPLKTSPSGGARHPIDVYVLARRIRGLRGGLYYYAADRHRLVGLRSGAARGRIVRYLPEQDWYEDAAALVFFVASFERVRWRYAYARAYRAAFIEAGHLCQTFCLTATWRGLAPFCSMALADSTIERDLDLDGVSESVLYTAGVGVPDGEAQTSFAPRDVTPPAVVPNPVFARSKRRRS